MPKWLGWRNARINMKRHLDMFKMDFGTMVRNMYLRLRYGRTRVDNRAAALREFAPPLRKGTKEAIENSALKDADGNPLDPNTFRPIEQGNGQFGHKYGHEWTKFSRDPANQGLTRQQVLDAQNNPRIYELENAQSNQGHAYEQNPATLHAYPLVEDPTLHDDLDCSP